MTLQEFEDRLASGFHDGEIHSIHIDYRSNSVTLDCSVWVWKDSGETEEVLRRARVKLTGVSFCVIEPPDVHYLWTEESLQVANFNPREVLDRKRGQEWPKNVPLGVSTDLLDALPAGAFALSFFVNDWNSFIHLAAKDISLDWVEEI